MPRASATTRAVATTLAGSLRLAPHLLRGEVGGVGLDQDQLVGQRRGGGAQVLGAWVGDVAGERAVPAALDRVADPSAAPRSSAGSPGARRPRVEGGEDLVDRVAAAVGVAGVDDDRQAEVDGDLDLGLEGAALLGGRGACRGSSRARSRRSPAPSRARRAARSPPQPPRRTRPPRSGGGRPRRRPPRCARPRRSPRRWSSAPRPTFSIRSTPACSAAASSSASGRSQRNRWVWESIIVAGGSIFGKSGAMRSILCPPGAGAELGQRRRVLAERREHPLAAARQVGDEQQRRHPQALDQVVEDLVEALGVGLVLGQLPRPGLLDEAVEAAHQLPGLLQRLAQLGPVEQARRSAPGHPRSPRRAPRRPPPPARCRRGSARPSR